TSQNSLYICFFFQAEDGIRDLIVTGVQTCALPIWPKSGGIGTLSRPSKPPVYSAPRLAASSSSAIVHSVNIRSVRPVVRKSTKRSEERRVGKSVDLGGRRVNEKKRTTVVYTR